MTLSAALWIAGAPLCLLALMVVILTKQAEENSAFGIVRRLRQTGEPVEVRLGRRGQAWKPGGQHGDHSVFGPGTGTYRLQRGPDGEDVVVLDFAETGGMELVQHLSGPIPPGVRPNGSRRRAPLVVMTLVPVSLGALGLLVGLAVTSGASDRARVIGLFAGTGVGLFLPVVGAWVFLIGNAVRQTVSGTKTAGDREPG